jgi:hypothetical protein
MNHAYLNQHSEIFVDDRLEQVEKRCFFLMCGKNFTEPMINLDLSVNIFNDPAIKMKVLFILSLN